MGAFAGMTAPANDTISGQSLQKANMSLRDTPRLRGAAMWNQPCEHYNLDPYSLDLYCGYNAWDQCGCDGYPPEDQWYGNGKWSSWSDCKWACDNSPTCNAFTMDTS